MDEITILYKLVDGGKVPVKLNDVTDAGFDVYAISEPEIKGKRIIRAIDGDDISDHNLYSSIDYIQYRTGLYIEPSDKSKVIRLDLRPRSSISKYWLSLCNTPATIDHTYGGEILVRFRPVWQPSTMGIIQCEDGENIQFAHSLDMSKIYKKGDRICQILPEYVKNVKWVEVDEISNDRSGFGSTGK
jgi:dUTPase